ncbi:S-protein 8 [Arabidopsis thaliana]
MHSLSWFLLVIGLSVGLSSGKWNEKNSVIFTNSLGRNKVLKVNCISNDDNLGFQFLRHGQTYDFSFHDSLFKSEFYCDLWQGPNFKLHAAFTAYEGGGLIVHYGKKNFWDVRDDGIYFTHGQKMPKLEYTWK